MGVWAAGRNPPACSMYPLGTYAPAYTRTHVHARALHRPGYSLTPSVNLQASIAASLSRSFGLLLSFPFDINIHLKINYKKSVPATMPVMAEEVYPVCAGEGM